MEFLENSYRLFSKWKVTCTLFELTIKITLFLLISLYSFLKSSGDKPEVTVTFNYTYMHVIKKLSFG